MVKFKVSRLVVLSLVFLSFGAFVLITSASHSWGGYHWARKSNPFTLKLGDNVTSAWDTYLGTTSSDWSVSSVLNTTIVAGQTKPKPCRAVYGKVQVCNSAYGDTGWLGVAQIWTSGSHIAQGTVRVNDTYFNVAPHNTSAWKNLVMCQEVGHTLGLGHQDENFTNPNLGTCMDYTSDPSTNQHPNAHDYAQLESIYAHLDSTTTVGQTLPNGNGKANVNLDEPAEWGKAIRESGDGRNSLYERDLGGGNKVFTFVIWANK